MEGLLILSCLGNLIELNYFVTLKIRLIVIPLVFFISMLQLISCALQASDSSLFERRKFSSLSKLILNRLFVIEERENFKYLELLNFKVNGIKEVLAREKDMIDYEIKKTRKNLKRKCLKFEKNICDLKKFDNSLELDETVQVGFAKLCVKVERFYKENLDLLMFDKDSVEYSQFFNQKVLRNMRRFAEKYHFSKEKIPPYIFVNL